MREAKAQTLMHNARHGNKCCKEALNSSHFLYSIILREVYFPREKLVEVERRKLLKIWSCEADGMPNHYENNQPTLIASVESPSYERETLPRESAENSGKSFMIQCRRRSGVSG